MRLAALLLEIPNLEPVIFVALYWFKVIKIALIAIDQFKYFYEGFLQTRPSFSIKSLPASGPHVPAGYL